MKSDVPLTQSQYVLAKYMIKTVEIEPQHWDRHPSIAMDELLDDIHYHQGPRAIGVYFFLIN